MTKLFSVNIWLLILFSFLSTFFIAYLIDFTVVTDTLYENSFSNKLSNDQMQLILEKRKNGIIINNFFVGIVYIFKFICIALVIQIGIYLDDYAIKFSQILKSVLVGSFIFILADFIKWIWFYFFVTPTSMKQLTFFMPFSLLNIFEIQTLSDWQITIFRVANIFDFMFVGIVAFGLTTFCKKLNFEKATLLILKTYGIAIVIILGLKIWISLYASNR